MLPPLSAASACPVDATLISIASDPACPLAALSVLAIRNGRVAYAANDQMLYRIASVSKLVTTLGSMRLVEAGQLALDQDVSAYLGFRLTNPHFPAARITLRMLLSHTSSLRDDAGYAFPFSVALRDAITPAMWSPRAVPGAYFTYCNLGFGLIGTIMERVTGERFDLLMQRLILAPLGLHGGYNVAELAPADRAHLATLYRKRTVDTEVWDLQGPWIAQADARPAPLPGLATYVPGTNATPFSPTGGLRTSARDLGVLMQMLMNSGQHQGSPLLQEATLQAMFTRTWTDDGGNGDTLHGFYRAWGLGNQQFPGHALVDRDGFDAVGHLGDAYGLRAIFAVDIARRNGMVVLIGGTGADPATQPGQYCALARFEENIVTALYRCIIEA